MEHEGRCVGNHVNAYTSDMDFHGGSKLSKLTYPIKTIYSKEARVQLRKVLDDFQPDVCHLNNFNYQLTPSMILEIVKWRKKTRHKCKIVFTGAKLGGVQYITIHSHNAGFGAAGNGIRFISKILKPLIPLFCDNFYGCSELAARFLFPRSIIESGRCSVLPNGIDLEKYDYNEAVRREIRKKLNLEGKYVVGHAGRFSDQKNHSFLLDIFQGLVDDDKGFTNLIVQSSKGERILDRIADRYELYATNLEKAIELDGTMICHSAEPHPRRDEYYLNLDKETLRAHIQKFVPIRIRDYLIEKSKGIFYRMGVSK